MIYYLTPISIIYHNLLPALSAAYILMGEIQNFLKSWTLEIQIFKLEWCLLKLIITCLNGKMCLDNL